MSESLIFIGLDLAWSGRNNSAAAVISYTSGENSGRLVSWREQLGDNAAIINFVREAAGTPTTPALLAIDAPLVVPNVSGARLGERLLSQIFRRYQAGAHPANRTNLGRYGDPPGNIRGETLAQRLEHELNFSHNPYLEAHTPTRQFFECYPHPAMVAIFGLNTTLKYKRKLRSRDNDRFAAYDELQNYLRQLAEAEHEPRFIIPPEILARDTRLIRPASALKHYEDLLDALMCAYIAFYYWWWGSAKTFVFGDMTNGYIVSPVTPELKTLAQQLTITPSQ